jgi:AGZA family xanthine/uracil permease-like MFS transporter
MFDTVGTLIACAGKSGIIREDGSIPMAKKALMSDAIGTTAGAILGTSTITTFVESSAGVAVGGRTGLTAVTTGIMFIISMFLAPLFGSIPSAATAPALIIVGVMMVSSVKEIDFDDLTEAIPAFLTIITMICASSISTGIMFGVMSYTVIKMLSGKFKELHVTTYIVAALFLIKIILDIVK